MKTQVHIFANVNGIYRFSLAEFATDSDIFDFHTLIVRADVTGERAEMLAEALSQQRASYVNIETRITREEN